MRPLGLKSNIALSTLNLRNHPPMIAISQKYTPMSEHIGEAGICHPPRAHQAEMTLAVYLMTTKM